MAQLVTRMDDRLVAALDELVDQGVVSSRSDAVREGLRLLVDHHQRRRLAEAVVAGYRRRPQTEDELGWSDEATRRMISEEPW